MEDVLCLRQLALEKFCWLFKRRMPTKVHSPHNMHKSILDMSSRAISSIRCQASTSFMFGLRIIAVVSVEAGPPDCTLAIRLSDLAKPKEFLRAGKSVETSIILSRTQGSQGSSIKIQLGSV